jgi:hypothetical protein
MSSNCSMQLPHAKKYMETVRERESIGSYDRGAKLTPQPATSVERLGASSPRWFPNCSKILVKDEFW